MKYKVVHLIDGLKFGGGAETQLALNLRFIDQSKFENHVVHLGTKEVALPGLESSGAQIHSLGLATGKEWFRGAMRLRKIIKQHQIDLVHASLANSEIIGALAGKMTGKPVIGTLLNTSYGDEWLVDNPHLNRWKLRFVRMTRALAARYGDAHVLAISEASRQSGVAALGIKREKVSIVYRALAPEWFVEPKPEEIRQLKASLGLAPEVPVVLTVGRVVAQKGQRYLIEALPKIAEKHKDVCVLIAGSAERGDTVAPLLQQTCQRLGVTDRVRFLGNRTDIKQLLHMSDVAVFPSLYEGFGNALAEACATGRATVATRIGGFTEIVRDGETGLLVDPRSPEQMAAAVIRLLDNREYAVSVGQKAREHVKAQFSIENTIKGTEQVYENVIRRTEKRKQATASGAATRQ